MQGYRTIARNSEIELTIKKSRFIGRAIAASDPDAAIAEIGLLKKRHWDATHNCYAYICGENNDVMRYSDDGEPQGTAGQPILEVISRKGLTNTLVVITRYFGGILLGAGGLIRAYSQAAANALDEAGTAEYTLCCRVYIDSDYSLWPRLEPWLGRAGCHVEDVEYAGNVGITLLVREQDYEPFIAALMDFTNGRIDTLMLEKAVVKLPTP